jgi:hypothetical protein
MKSQNSTLNINSAKMLRHQIESIKDNRSYATLLICLSILFYWFFIALHSGQTFYETQHSQLLLRYGAVDSQLLNQELKPDCPVL